MSEQLKTVYQVQCYKIFIFKTKYGSYDNGLNLAFDAPDREILCVLYLT